MRHLGTIFVLAAAVSVTGCGQFGGAPSASKGGGTAVVDLDKVAAETGRDRQLAQSLEMAQNSLNQSYAKTVESARDELNAKKKEYGEEISEKEKKEFLEMERNAITQLSQIQNKARADFEAYKQKQIAMFRMELKPIAQEIAAKRGLSIVVPKNDGLLLSVDPGVDITDDVIKILREKHPIVTSAVAPEPSSAPAAKSSPAKKNVAMSKSAGTNRTANADEDDEEPIR